MAFYNKQLKRYFKSAETSKRAMVGINASRRNNPNYISVDKKLEIQRKLRKQFESGNISLNNFRIKRDNLDNKFYSGERKYLK